MKKILYCKVATRQRKGCGKEKMCQKTVPIFAASDNALAKHFASSGEFATTLLVNIRNLVTRQKFTINFFVYK